MPFHPGDLPPAVQKLFNDPNLPTMNDLFWAAVENGVKNTNDLTDMLFYKYNLGLIGQALKPSMEDYDQLAAEWKFYNDFVRKNIGGSPKKSGSSVWKPYKKSIYKESTYLTPAVKKWLSRPPKHTIEVGVFKSKRTDNGTPLHFYGWKTTDSRMKCLTHKLHDGDVLHGRFEHVTSLAGVKMKHKLKTDIFSILGNDAGAKGIAAMNLFVNELMFIYIFKRGMCAQRAEALAWRKAREYGKALIEYAVAVVSAAGGAKPGSPGGLPSKPHTAAQKVSELDWKGFVQTLHGVVTKKSSPNKNLGSRTTSLKIDEWIKEDGVSIGAIRYFD